MYVTQESITLWGDCEKFLFIERARSQLSLNTQEVKEEYGVGEWMAPTSPLAPQERKEKSNSKREDE